MKFVDYIKTEGLTNPENIKKLPTENKLRDIGYIKLTIERLRFKALIDSTKSVIALQNRVQKVLTDHKDEVGEGADEFITSNKDNITASEDSIKFYTLKSEAYDRVLERIEKGEIDNVGDIALLSTTSAEINLDDLDSSYLNAVNIYLSYVKE